MSDTIPLIKATRTVQLRHTPEQLWPLLSATDKLNPEWDLGAVEYAPKPNARGGSDIVANSRIFGLKIAWDEFPFEWIEPARWQVKRVFANGPLKQLLFTMELAPAPNGSTATYTYEYEPRGALYKWIVARGVDK